MSSKREEERNEKIIRGLLKLPPNRRCINCNGLGPQYVCTNFWTFVCTACSGIHREFTHRVKSVSMAKFTSQEVEALQNGGNQRARELFLKDWDIQNMKLPDSSYPDKIREFIKNVYVEKKYSVGRSSDKPPIDPQGLKSHDEHRRASSYHSFSQSPPYEHQYEDRRYGKPRIMLSRKPGSDNGHYEGNISSILSPSRNREQVYEDRFANESSTSRISDYSISSPGDPFKSGGQSPSAHSNPSSQQKSASLGNFGSFESNTLYSKSTNFCALSDVTFEPEHASTQRPNNSTIVSQKTSAPQIAAINDIFSLQFSQPHDMKTSVDLFADFNNQPSCTSPSENKTSSVPISGNEGWAMFDFVHQVAPDPEAKDLPSVIPPGIGESVGISEGFSSKKDTAQLFTAQTAVDYGKLASTTDQWDSGFSGIQNAPNSLNTPVWNAFDDSFEKNPPALFANSPQGHVLVSEPGPSIFGGQHTDVAKPKDVRGTSPVLPEKNRIHPQESSRQPARSTQEWKSTNPFDLSYDLDAGSSNMFLGMSSLQAALPKPQLPNAFLDGLSEPWFQQNSTSIFSPSIPQVASPYVGSQVPTSHLPNLPSQGSTASGNPFA